MRLAVLLRLGSAVANLHRIVWYILAYSGLGIDYTLFNYKNIASCLSEISRSIECCTTKRYVILTAPFWDDQTSEAMSSTCFGRMAHEHR